MYEIGFHSSDEDFAHVAWNDGTERDELFDVQLYGAGLDPLEHRAARQASLDALQQLVKRANHPLAQLTDEQAQALFQLAEAGAEQLDYDINDHWGQYRDDPASQASAQATLDIYNTIRR